MMTYGMKMGVGESDGSRSSHGVLGAEVIDLVGRQAEPDQIRRRRV